MRLRPAEVPLLTTFERATLVELATPQFNNGYADLPPAYQAIIRLARARTDRTALNTKLAAAKAGIGVSTLWRDVKNGVFVPPIKLSERRVAWLNVEIDAILEAKILMSRSDHEVDLRTFVSALISSSTCA